MADLTRRCCQFLAIQRRNAVTYSATIDMLLDPKHTWLV
jgi:hypothetical protein